jgi:hypothetical protein
LIYSGQPFDLNSAWVTTGVAPDPLRLLNVVAFYGTVAIFTNSYLISSNVPVHLRFDIQNVTGVQFSGGAVVLDNLSVTVAQDRLPDLPGWFTPGTLYFPPSDALALGAGDFNGDGLGDLVIGGRFGSAVAIGLSNGTLRMLTNAVSGNFIAIADVTQDGRDDAIMVGGGTLLAGSARLIQFTNTFGYSTDGLTNGLSATGTAAYADFGGTNRLLRVPKTTDIAVADFNGDGKLDYVALNIAEIPGRDPFIVQTNRGDGTFAEAWFESAFASYTHGHSSVIARDFDGDGDMDFATAEERSGAVGIFQNSKATFGTVKRFDTGLARPVTVAAADLDGDGIEDLVVRSAFSGLSILRGLGAGRFAAPLVITHGESLPSSVRVARTLAVHDLNGDGAPDIAFVSGTEVATLLNVFPPRLHVTTIEDFVEVYWPTNFAKGAILESSTTLGPNAVWTAVTFPPIDAAGNRIVFNSGEESRVFFRLRRPQ